MDLARRLRARVAPAFSEDAPGYDPCHDLHHLDRVARLARHIAARVGADAEVVEAASYLHDLDRTGAADRLAAARAHLAAVGAPAGLVERVVEAVDRHKDKSFEAKGVRPRSLEATVLSDADKLEAIGAIGVARAFGYGGMKGRAMWDGAPLVAASTYVSGAGGTTLQHFHDKLLRIRDDLVTDEARRLGDARHRFLRRFLDAFHEEWAGAPAASGQDA